MALSIHRLPQTFSPDPSRVILRFFMPGGPERARKILKRIMVMQEENIQLVLNQTLRDFSNRHRNITRIFQKHFEHVVPIAREIGLSPESFSREQRLLIGAYFTHEYSIESAAFFNPSMVEDPDQAHLERGQKRVIVSFRSTGEGHVSSIAFRGGIIDKHCNLHFNVVSKLVDGAESIQIQEYNKADFIHKLQDMKLQSLDVVDKILTPLPEHFQFRDLKQSEDRYVRDHPEISLADKKVLQAIRWIANAQYQITFSLDTSLSERVIFPVTDSESNGIEDARFVRFTYDDGRVSYYATYTAYNGFVILPQLIETDDFYTFRVMPIYGKFAQNKGMALFPRKINGHYAMLSRHDGENNYIMFSDQINNWDSEATLLQEPVYPWEMMQLGNSGSPIETDRGWLVITHGVGAMRKYVLGAILLDINDPTKVIGKMTQPLLVPNEKEREGYVPNVVYSCGSIIHNDKLVIPYAMSDTSSGFAYVSLHDIFANMDMVDETKTRLADQAKRILIVDDDALSLELLKQLLEPEGYHINTATDGIDALHEISKAKYDLILSDISMPNFSGYQLLAFMQQKNIDIPVVFLSRHVTTEDEIKGLKMGAVEYLKKPVQPDLLLLRLQKLLQH